MQNIYSKCIKSFEEYVVCIFKLCYNIIVLKGTVKIFPLKETKEKRGNNYENGDKEVQINRKDAYSG